MRSTWDGIKPLIKGLKPQLRNKLFDKNYYLNKSSDVKSIRTTSKEHHILYGTDKSNKTDDRIKISVIVTSYNHEKYIQQCIDNILIQQDVDFELIIGDDCSNDNTRNILEKYQKKHPKIINLLPKTENLGVTKNIKRCLDAVKGEYIAFCEGDDYWTDPLKLLKQSNYLKQRDNCSICFNSILLYYEGKTEKNREHHKHLKKDIFKTRDLVLDNFIGNFSCCMYKTETIKKLPDSLFDIFTVDWMFNIACSQYGDIGFLNENMSVYRIHDTGLWSSRDNHNQYSELAKLIDIYNNFFSYEYDNEFKENNQYKNLKLQCDISDLDKNDFQDIIILDDIFPLTSDYGLQENHYYLKHFNNIKIYSDGRALGLERNDHSLKIAIDNYNKKHPQFQNKVQKFDLDKILKGKFIYMLSIENAIFFLDFIEKNQIPFIFTLYPDETFQMNNKLSDERLRRVFNSPYFKKVIVTQKIIHDYLLEKNLCKSGNIEKNFCLINPMDLDEESIDTKYFNGEPILLKTKQLYYYDNFIIPRIKILNRLLGEF